VVIRTLEIDGLEIGGLILGLKDLGLLIVGREIGKKSEIKNQQSINQSLNLRSPKSPILIDIL
jgi:hypothetical protein